MLLACAGLAACKAEQPAQETAPAAGSPSVVVDSAFPVEEEIRRFKATRGGASARALEGGAASAEDLVRRFIAALEAQDTATFRGLVMNAGEYIDLYYPTSIYYKPPYRQSPELNWFLMQENSNKGFTRLTRRYGGQPTGYTGYRCTEVKIEGENRLHDRCSVTWSLKPSPMRVFSTIIERHGRFKFMSYANDL